MILAVEQAFSSTFPLHVALLAKSDAGNLLESHSTRNRFVLLECESFKKYLPWASHPKVSPGCIVLPLYAASSKVGLKVSCKFVSDIDCISTKDTISIRLSSLNYSTTDVFKIPSKLITFRNDTILVKHNSEFWVLGQVLTDSIGEFAVDPGTAVRVARPADETCIEKLLNCEEFLTFRDKLIDPEKGLSVSVLKNLCHRHCHSVIDYFSRNHNTLHIIDTFDKIMSLSECRLNHLGSDLYVFLLVDFIADEQDMLYCYRQVLFLSAMKNRVLLLVQSIPDIVLSMMEAEGIGINELDITFLPTAVKQAAFDLGNLQNLAGIPMKGLLRLKSSTDPLEELLKLQKEAFSQMGEIVDPSSTSWHEVAGYRKQISELKNAAYDYLRYEREFTANRVKPTRGVFLYGPSGCGKTLLARTLASDSLLPVLSLPTLSLYSKYFGETEARLRAVFRRARLVAPCILIIDDVDVIAPKRGSEPSDTSGVSFRLLTTLLNELDGIEAEVSQQVVVVACSAYPEAIDPAFLRPGRMDVHIELGLPSVDDRREIIELLLGKIRCSVSAEDIVSRTDNYTPADLVALFQEAARRAIHGDRNVVEMDDISSTLLAEH